MKTEKHILNPAWSHALVTLVSITFLSLTACMDEVVAPADADLQNTATFTDSRDVNDSDVFLKEEAVVTSDPGSITRPFLPAAGLHFAMKSSCTSASQDQPEASAYTLTVTPHPRHEGIVYIYNLADLGDVIYASYSSGRLVIPVQTIETRNATYQVYGRGNITEQVLYLSFNLSDGPRNEERGDEFEICSAKGTRI